MNTYTDLHKFVKAAGIKVQTEMRDHDVTADFDLSINVTGRCQEHEFKIEYVLRAGLYSARGEAKGRDLDQVVWEVLRRLGFNKDQEAKLISYEEKVQTTEPVEELI